MIEVTYLGALLAGLLMFLAPCTLPILPAFISFLLGTLKDGGKSHTLKVAGGFALGFTVIFVVLGILSSSIGGLLIGWKEVLTRIGGLMIILFGLSMLGAPVFDKVLSKIPRFRMNKVPNGIWQAATMGSIFALTWSPCLGPILGTILVVAATQSEAVSGGLLLLAFSLGYCVPFLILALFVEKLQPVILNISKYILQINRIGGIIMIAIGLLMLVKGSAALVPTDIGIFDITQYEWVIERI